jgi:hypothetical protein
MLKLAVLGVFGIPIGVIAQETAPALPPWASWGVLGLVIAGIITRQLVPGWSYNDLKVENKELKADNTRLVNLVLDTQKSTIPAIEASTSAVADAIAEIRALRGRST